jgi:hypothetical protein
LSRARPFIVAAVRLDEKEAHGAGEIRSCGDL